MPLFSRPRSFEFPGDADRVAVVGSTGSGKSTFAFWLMAESGNFDKIPWIIFDYKNEDDIIIQMVKREYAEKINLDKAPPKRPGLYVANPKAREPVQMADFLWRCFDRGHTGFFFDELSSVPEFKGVASSGGPLKSILTQGRSKKLPVYGLVQRPVEVNLHILSEATFISEFYLKKDADKERVLEYIPDRVAHEGEPFDPDRELPNHWSRWWDDRRRLALVLKPSPPPNKVLDIIGQRVAIMREKERL